MKHVILVISLLALVSCKDSKNKETQTNTNGVETTYEYHNDKTSKLFDNSWTKEIKTSNGSKWQANAETNEGVKNMQNSIKTQTTNTLKEYYKLAKQLNNDISYVIKNCTMKGASHNNLHVWLLPLMEKIEALSEAKTIEDASKLKHSIEENINGYSDYFK